jgi:hypothetical protein
VAVGRAGSSPALSTKFKKDPSILMRPNEKRTLTTRILGLVVFLLLLGLIYAPFYLIIYGFALGIDWLIADINFSSALTHTVIAISALLAMISSLSGKEASAFISRLFGKW